MSLAYKILLKPEPEDGYTINVPVLHGCITYGVNIEEASLAKEVIELNVEILKAHLEDVPFS